VAKSSSLSKLVNVILFVWAAIFLVAALWLFSIVVDSVTPQDIAITLIIVLAVLVAIFIARVSRSRRGPTRPSRPYQEKIIIYEVEDEEEEDWEDDDWFGPMRDLDKKLKDFDDNMFDSFRSSPQRKSSKRRKKSKKDNDWFAPMRDFKF